MFSTTRTAFTATPRFDQENTHPHPTLQSQTISRDSLFHGASTRYPAKNSQSIFQWLGTPWKEFSLLLYSVSDDDWHLFYTGSPCEVSACRLELVWLNINQIMFTFSLIRHTEKSQQGWFVNNVKKHQKMARKAGSWSVWVRESHQCRSEGANKMNWPPASHVKLSGF